VIGHASGKINDGVGQPRETLKNYASTIEEGRADLVALYFVMDPKLVEWGLMPSLEVGKAEYDGYLRNGLLVQLRRVGEGKDLDGTPLGDGSGFFGNEYGIVGFPGAIGFDGANKGKENTISPFLP